MAFLVKLSPLQQSLVIVESEKDERKCDARGLKRCPWHRSVVFYLLRHRWQGDTFVNCWSIETFDDSGVGADREHDGKEISNGQNRNTCLRNYTE